VSTQTLTSEQQANLRSICDAILPSGPEGPGAEDANVAEYILGQLSGGWGRGARMFREGPFIQPAHSGHGWQSAMTPAEVYRYGLDILDRYSRKTFGSAIAALDVEQRDELVSAWSTGRVEGFADVDGPQFFRTVRDNVAEGLFCDPSHGGNRDMVGWRWVGYPGVAEAHGGYRELIEDHDAPHTVAPRALDRQAGMSWSAGTDRSDGAHVRGDTPVCTEAASSSGRG
jgi:gluconate 2-dehydrogenase gamma chain